MFNAKIVWANFVISLSRQFLRTTLTVPENNPLWSGGWAMRSALPEAESSPRNAKALRRAVVGLIASVGAFLAFGMTPLAMMPSAHADEFELIVDPIIDSLSSVDPTLAVDMTGWLANLDSALAAAWDAVDALEPGSWRGRYCGIQRSWRARHGCRFCDVNGRPFDTWLTALSRTGLTARWVSRWTLRSNDGSPGRSLRGQRR